MVLVMMNQLNACEWYMIGAAEAMTQREAKDEVNIDQSHHATIAGFGIVI